jgi:predicted transcriptional regulator
MRNSANSIQLPDAVMRRVNRAAKSENRDPSDLAAEALQWYFRMRALPDEIPTQAELRAIRRGRQAFERGEYITLDEFRQENPLVRSTRKARRKIT